MNGGLFEIPMCEKSHLSGLFYTELTLANRVMHLTDSSHLRQITLENEEEQKAERPAQFGK